MRRTITPKLCLSSAQNERVPAPAADDEDENTQAEVNAAKATKGVAVVESFFHTNAFSYENEFQNWLSTGDDMWVYTTTSRQDVLVIAEYGIHSIFAVCCGGGKAGRQRGLPPLPAVVLVAAGAGGSTWFR